MLVVNFFCPGVKGIPLLGNAAKMYKEFKSGNAGEDLWLTKLHAELGPIYRLRMFGKYVLLDLVDS